MSVSGSRGGGLFLAAEAGGRARLTALIALLMAWVLGVTLLEAIAAPQAAQAAPADPAKTADTPLERPDEASAMVTAQILGKRVEVTGLRTETSTTFANPDGTWTSDTNARPVRVEQPDGSWRPVDTDLQRTADGDVVPAETPADIELSGDTAAATPTLASVALDGKRVAIGWPTKLPKPALDGDTALYANVLPDVDLKMRATSEGFAKEIVVKTPEAAKALGSTVRIPLSGKGLTFSLDATGALLAKDARGNVVFTAPSPIMWDATTDARTGEHTRQAPVGITLDSSGGKQALVLTPDQDMFTDPATTYPVIVDPGVTIARTAWTYVDRGFPDTSYYKTTDDLKVGTYNAGSNLLRSLIGYPVGTVKGKDIVKATLNTRVVHSWSCTATQVRVYPLSDGSSFGSGTVWSNQPTVGPIAASTTVAGGYSSACPARDVNFDLTPEIAAASDAGKTSVWFQIRSGDESSTSTANTFWKKFANNPSLSVTYNQPPTNPSPRSTVPATKCVTDSTRTFINTLTPTLKGVAKDPDGGKVRVQFQITGVGSTAVVASGTTAYAGSGSTFSWKVPAEKLADSTPYSYIARTHDGRLWSGWSPECQFSTDVTAPTAAPTVTSSDFPEGEWGGSKDTPGGFVLGAGGTADITKYSVVIDDAAAITVAPATQGGDYTLSYTPPANGPHTLTVRAIDRAGGASPATTYDFNVGQGAVVDPAVGDVRGSHTRLTAAAASTAEKVTYQWIRADDGTFIDIPVADVTLATGGAITPTAGGAWTVGRSANGMFPDLNWNIAATLAGAGQVGDDGAVLDGPIRVRAVFSNAAGTSFPSDPAKFSFDRKLAAAATAEVGPGSVNLLTGDLTVADTDATVDAFASDLTLSRSYSSRGHADNPHGVFGPGWVSGVSVDSAGVDYTGLTVAGPTVAVLTGDGDTLTFVANSNGRFVPEPGLETLELIRTAANGTTPAYYTLTDREDGTEVEFRSQTSGATQAWVVATVRTPNSEAQDTRYAFDLVTVDGTTVRRPTRMLAPTPGVTCDLNAPLAPPAASLKGCRMLVFSYDAATQNATTQITVGGTTAGPRPDRINAVDLVAWDPATAQMKRTALARYAYDTTGTGRLRAVWDPRLDHTPAGGTLTHHADTYSYDSDGVLTTITPHAEPAWQLTYTTLRARDPDDVTPYGAADPGAGRLAQVSRAVPVGADGTQTAKTTVVYRVPVSGGAAPHNLSTGQTARWGQDEAPVDATAVFSADQVPAIDQTAGNTLGHGDYTRATISYLDANGREINTATPSGAGEGAIATTTYDVWGNVVRSLTPGNRARALDDGAASVVAAAELDTRNVYDPTGQQLRETFGPRHEITIPSSIGDSVLTTTRTHTVTTYDKGDGTDHTGGSFNLPVSVTTSARLDDGTDVDARTTTTTYDWTLRQPTVTTVVNGNGAGTGPATTTTRYVPGLGLPQSVTTPAGGDSVTTPRTTVATYYTAGATGGADCGNRPEWAGLVCQAGPGGQPAAGPKLPVTRTEYDMFNSPTVMIEKDPAGAELRRTVTRYDAAGRTTHTATTSSVSGTALPATRTVYDPATGLPTRTESVPLAAGADLTDGTIDSGDLAGAATATTSQVHDDLGRVASYTDADGNTSTTTYDLLGRVDVTDDGKGTQNRTYHPTTGELTGLVDSHAGTFTAGYDIDGNLVTETAPNGVTATTRYDEIDTPTQLTYTAEATTTDAAGVTTTTEVVLADDRVTETIHEQQSDRDLSLGGGVHAEHQTYRYDAAGRLTAVQDTLNGSCTTRTYRFDDATNRTGLDAAGPGADGICQTGSPVSRTWGYDAADRHTDAGYAADAFGRFTTVPAADTPNPAGGNITVGYHVNDLVRTLTQNGRTTTYALDVDQNRVRSWTDATGGVTTSRTHHYDGSSDNPAWTDEGTGWTRNIGGIGGDLSAIHHSATGNRFQVANLHGDVIATTGTDGTLTAANGTTDEYGTPRDSATIGQRRYGWLGTKQRAADTPGGLTLMGVRLYNPATGRFLSTDPIAGGNANAYEYCSGDPVNCTDLDGRFGWKKWGKKAWGFVKRHKVDIALTALSFVPGVGAAVWAYRGYRGVRAASAAVRGLRTFGKKAVHFISNGNNYMRVNRRRISFGPAKHHWKRMSPRKQSVLRYHIHMDRGYGGMDNWVTKKNRTWWNRR